MLPSKFWKYVSKGDTSEDCWEWLGAHQRGYGVCDARYYKTSRPHRVTYEELVGPIPEGLQLDHLCRNRGCCNPAHLEPVTLHVNNVVRGTGLAAQNARKTECPRGHKYDYINSQGRRTCFQCNRENLQKSRNRKKDLKAIEECLR